VTISDEESDYRLETAVSISVVGSAVAGLRGEVAAMRWTITGFGAVFTVLLGAIFTYLIMHG